MARARPTRTVTSTEVPTCLKTSSTAPLATANSWALLRPSSGLTAETSASSSAAAWATTRSPTNRAVLDGQDGQPECHGHKQCHEGRDLAQVVATVFHVSLPACTGGQSCCGEAFSPGDRSVDLCAFRRIGGGCAFHGPVVEVFGGCRRHGGDLLAIAGRHHPYAGRIPALD